MAEPFLKLGDDQVFGIDKFHSLEDIAPGYYRSLENLSLEAGNAVSRPGKRALFTSPSGNPMYEPFPYYDGTNTKILWSEGGKLYKWAEGDTGKTEIKDYTGASLSLTSSGVFMDKAGKYAYLIDGVGALHRTDAVMAGGLGTGTDTLRSLTAPTAAATLALTNTTIDATSDTSLWSGIAAVNPTAQLLANNDFESVGAITTGSSRVINTWTAFGKDADALDANASMTPYSGTYALVINDPGEGVYQDVACPAVANANGPTSVARVYYFNGWFRNADSTGKSTALLDITPLDSSHNPMGAPVRKVISTPYDATATKWTFVEHAANFGGLGADPAYIRVSISGGPENLQNSALSTMYVDLVAFYALNTTLAPAAATAGTIALTPTASINGQVFSVRITAPGSGYGAGPGSFAMSFSGGGGSGAAGTAYFSGGVVTAVVMSNFGSGYTSAPTPSFAAGAGTGATATAVITQDHSSLASASTAGQWIRRYYATPNTSLYATTNIIACSISLPNNVRPGFRFGLQKSGSTTIDWAQDCQYGQDGSGTYIYGDISTIPDATRASVQYFYLQFLTDLPAGAYTTVATIGPISAAGNLSIGYYYTYWYTEFKVVSGQGIEESNPSPASAQILTTGQKAEVIVTLPSGTPYNTSNADGYAFYRAGGNGGGNKFLAAVSKTANTVYGPDFTTATAPPSAYVTWSYTGKALTDNLQDLYLLDNVTTLLDFSRGAAPSGAQAIASHQGRLWLAKGNTIYVSSLLSTDNSAALYYATINRPDDPNLETEGSVFSIGGADNDTIMRLVSWREYMVVFKQRGIYIVSGSDATNFRANVVWVSGIGLIARRAVGVHQNDLVFLASDGLYRFNNGNPVLISDILGQALNPSLTGDTSIPAAYYANCSILTAHDNLYLFAPGSATDTTNTICYVHHGRYQYPQGWTTWNQMTVTGGASRSYASDTDPIYVAGLDGMIYQMTSYGDTSTYGGAVSDVTWAITTRGVSVRGRTLKPTKLHWQVIALEEAGLSATVTGDSSFDTLDAYTIDAATYPFRPKNQRVSGVSGGRIYVGFTAATSTKFTFLSWGIDAAETRDYS